MGICEVCKDLAVSAEADLVITTKLFDIDQKAAQGCQTCRMLAEGLSDFDMISKDEEVRLHGAVFPSGDASLRVANHGLEIVHYEGSYLPRQQCRKSGPRV